MSNDKLYRIGMGCVVVSVLLSLASLILELAGQR